MFQQSPIHTTEEAHARQTFLGLMWALSYPGRVYTLPTTNPYQTLADTLLDLETSFFSPDDELSPYLARTGARALPPNRAAYHFYPVLDEHLLSIVEQAAVGTMLFPDEGATLIIGAQLGTGIMFRLQGPGVPPGAVQNVRIAGIPQTFWQLRTTANHYPLGWDIYLIDGAQVLGLPRTTHMTLAE